MRIFALINLGSDLYAPYYLLTKSTLFQELRQQEQKDEEFVRSLYGRTNDGKIIKRIVEENDDERTVCKSRMVLRYEQTVKIEPSQGEQKPSCSASISSLKGHFPEPSVLVRKTSQRDMLSRMVAVKKPKVEDASTIAVEKMEVGSSVHNPNEVTGSKGRKVEVSLGQNTKISCRLVDYKSDSNSD